MKDLKYFAYTIFVFILLFGGVPLVNNGHIRASDTNINGFNAEIVTEVGEVTFESETKDFSANTEPKFEIDKSYFGGIATVTQFGLNTLNKGLGIFGRDTEHQLRVDVYNYNDELVDNQSFTYEESPEKIALNTEEFVPGVYTFKATDESTGNTIEQDFTWGVLAINTNKSIYTPGETAKLSIAVLDEVGEMVCDAKVKLTISFQNTIYKILNTSDGSIKVNEACKTKEFTLEPDYEAEYQVEMPGTYEMMLSAETKNGSFTIIDQFEVKDSVEFDIERTSATRLFPANEYPVIFNIKVNKDFSGIVEEKVPSSFRVYYLNNNELKGKFGVEKDLEKGLIETLPAPIDEKYKTLTWKVDWKAGETYHLAYYYDAPDKSPDFYLLGPLELKSTNQPINQSTIFTEQRYWQLAIDALTLNDFIGFETGGAEEAEALNGTGLIQSSTKRTGTYGLQTDSGESYEMDPFLWASDSGNDLIVGFWFYSADVTPSSASRFFRAEEDPDDLVTLTLETNGNVTVGYNSGTPDTITAPFTDATWHLIEIHWQELASGAIDIYIDGGDTATFSQTGKDMTDADDFDLYFLESSAYSSFYFDDFYSYSGGSGTGDFLEEPEVYGYTSDHNTNQDQGDILTNGVWSDAGETPGNDSNEIAYDSSPALGGYTIADGTGGGPSGDSNIDGDSNIKAGKYIHRLKRTTGSAPTTLDQSYGNNIDGMTHTDQAAALGTTYGNFAVISTSASVVPTSSEYFAYGIRQTGSGGRDIYAADIWATLLHIPTQTDTFTGIAYTNEGTTPDTSATICARVDNTAEACDATDGSGEFVISLATDAGSQLTFFYDSGGRGNTVTIADGGNIVSGDNLKVYENVVMVRHEQGSDISIVDMDTYDSDQNDTDMLYDAESTPTLSLEPGVKFHVYSDGTNNFTFNPDGTVTTTGSYADFIVNGSGTSYFDTATNTIAGDLVASGSATLYIDNTTNVNGGDIITTGSSASINRSAGTAGPVVSSTGSIGGGTTPTLVFNALTTSGSGTTTLSDSATVQNDVSVGAGTTLNVNADLSVGGNFTNSTSGIINTTSGTPTVTMTNNTSSSIGGGTTGNITLHHLTTSGTGTHTFTGDATNTFNGNITVGTGTTLNIDDSISVTGNFQNTTTGVIGTSAGTPTVTVQGTTLGGGSGAITIYNLIKSGAGTTTFSGSGTNTISNDLSVNAGTFTQSNTTTVTNDVSVATGATYNVNATLNVNGGDFTTAGTGIINTTAGTPTVTLTSNTTGSLGGGNGDITLDSLSTSGTGTFTFSGGGTNTFNGTLTAGTGSTLNLNSSALIDGNLTNTTTGIIGYSGTPTITMTGTSNSIGGGSGTIDFYNLTIDPSSAGTISLNSNATVDSTLNIASGDTLGGSSTLLYPSSQGFPSGGTFNANLRIDGTSGSRNITDRTNGYGGNVEIYSNSGTSKTFTLGNGAVESIDITGNLILNANNSGAVELDGNTHDPAVNITGNLDSTNGGGTENITTGSGTWTVTGNVDLTDIGTFTATGNTFQMNGSSTTLTSAGESFNDFNATGNSVSTTDSMTVAGNFDVTGSASFTHGAGDMDVNGTFDVTSGTFVHGAGADIDIYIAGDFTIVDDATWTENTNAASQVIFDGDLDYADNTDPPPKQSIGNVVIGASPATTNLTTDYSSSSVTVIAGDYFNTCWYEMDIGNGGITLNTGSPGGTLDTSSSGSGTSPCSAGSDGDATTINDANKFEIQSGAVLVQDTSTVIFDDNDGTDAITSNTESFYNITIDDSNDDASLIIQLADALDVDNNLTITDGQLDANGSYQINVGGNWDNDSKFEAGTGKVVLDADSGTKTIDALGVAPDEFYDIEFNQGTSATWQLTTALEVDNNFTIVDGTVDVNGSNQINISNNYDNQGGTFTASTGTVVMDAQDAGNTLGGTMTGSSSFNSIDFDDSGNSGAWLFNADATFTDNFDVSGGTVTAPSSGTLTIAGNFTNDDGFTHNSSTVVFNDSGQDSYLLYSATTTFNNLTISTAGKPMYFEDTDLIETDVDGLLTIQGSNCTTGRVFLDGNGGLEWEINVSGGSTNIDYADIEDSKAIGTTIVAENSTEVNGGNTNWTVNEGACGSIEVRIKGDTRGFDGVRIK
jgi:hypothetical protein